MSKDDLPGTAAPSWHWRLASRVVMGGIAFTARAFLTFCAKIETHGKDEFVRLLDERRDVNGRTRGLLTGMYA